MICAPVKSRDIVFDFSMSSHAKRPYMWSFPLSLVVSNNFNLISLDNFDLVITSDTRISKFIYYETRDEDWLALSSILGLTKVSKINNANTEMDQNDLDMFKVKCSPV